MQGEERMTREVSEKSFAFFSKVVDKAVKEGTLPRELAKKTIDSARENYRNQSYNRELDRTDKGRR